MKKIFLLIGLLLIAITAYIFFSETEKPVRKLPNPNEKTDNQPRKTLEVQTSEETPLMLDGIVVPAKTQNIIFKVSGTLENGEGSFTKGSKFRKNQLLFQVNNLDAFKKLQAVKLALKENLQNILTQLTTNSPTAKQEWEEYLLTLEPVSLIGEFPELNVEAEKTLINSMNIQEDHARIKKLEIGMADYFFIAPFDGIVMEMKVEAGKKIKSGQSIGLIGQNGKTLIKTIATDNLIEFRDGQNVNILNKQKEIIGKAKYLKSVSLKSGYPEVYFTIEKGTKLSLGNEVIIEK